MVDAFQPLGGLARGAVMTSSLGYLPFQATRNILHRIGLQSSNQSRADALLLCLARIVVDLGNSDLCSHCMRRDYTILARG